MLMNKNDSVDCNKLMCVTWPHHHDTQLVYKVIKHFYTAISLTYFIAYYMLSRTTWGILPRCKIVIQ